MRGATRSCTSPRVPAGSPTSSSPTERTARKAAPATTPTSSGPRPSDMARRGMSLIEVLVVLAIGLLLIGVMVPATRSMLALDQRAAARKIALLYQRLHDEAIMRNRTFRISYYLDEDRYVVEPGEPGALVAASPEERETFEQEMRRKLELMDEDQKKAWFQSNRQPFESLGKEGTFEIELPGSVVFGGFYTAQYGEDMI